MYKATQPNAAININVCNKCFLTSLSSVLCTVIGSPPGPGLVYRTVSAANFSLNSACFAPLGSPSLIIRPSPRPSSYWDVSEASSRPTLTDSLTSSEETHPSQFESLKPVKQRGITKMYIIQQDQDEIVAKVEIREVEARPRNATFETKHGIGK